MIGKISKDGLAQRDDRATLQRQASDLIRQECQQYIKSTKLLIESNKLSIEAHRIRLEIRDVQREIRTRKTISPARPDLEDLEARKQVLSETADELQAQAVHLLTEVMRLRARLVIYPVRK